MGTPAFAVPALKKLHQQGHQIIAVYCQPPRAKNRGYRLQKSAVHEVAEQMALSVYTPISLRQKEVQQEFSSHQAEAVVVAAYGLILPKAILEIPRYGCLNIHASLLPRWRGAAPIQRSILAGDPNTGVTIMQMEEGLDTGAMLKQEMVPITADTTTVALEDSLSLLGADLIVKTLEEVRLGHSYPRLQPEQGITYAAKLTKEEGKLDFSKSAVDLDLQVRALNPWPGTWFVHNETAIKVLKAHPITQKQGSNGQFWSDAHHPLIVNCGEGSLVLGCLQRPGGRALEAADFVRGYNTQASLIFEV